MEIIKISFSFVSCRTSVATRTQQQNTPNTIEKKEPEEEHILNCSLQK